MQGKIAVINQPEDGEQEEHPQGVESVCFSQPVKGETEAVGEVARNGEVVKGIVGKNVPQQPFNWCPSNGESYRQAECQEQGKVMGADRFDHVADILPRLHSEGIANCRPSCLAGIR